MLKHYVFMKYKDGTPADHIASFCEKMLALPQKIPGIKFLEIGRDELHDTRSWDLILIMRFQSVESLRTYQKHTEHKAVMVFNDPFVSDIASVDFEQVIG